MFCIEANLNQYKPDEISHLHQSVVVTTACEPESERERYVCHQWLSKSPGAPKFNQDDQCFIRKEWYIPIDRNKTIIVAIVMKPEVIGKIIKR